MKKVLFSLLCSVGVAAATSVVTSGVNVKYVNAGTPSAKDAGGAYVGPYTLNVNGQDMAAMCMDDFIFTSGSWKANVTNAASSNLGNTYLGNQNYNVDGYMIPSSEVYQAEAYLYSEIVKPDADRGHIQDAAWTIMDYVTGHHPHSSGDKAVDSIIADVVSNAGSFNASNYEILSQVNAHNEQEFMVGTPEPATWSLFGGSLLLLGLTRFWSRRSKQSANVN